GRRENLRGVFTCRRSWSSPGPVLAIVDDVVTTGATAAALTRSLLDAGAAEVHVLAATRMPRIGAGRCW
ncbi:MAG: ComF family protein, partial [Pseudomonadota bacterium]